jgi:hypothetical protein
MKYISKYSNDKEVSVAQYITELICEHKAKRDKSDLHYRFWTSTKWEAYYRNQIASAHKLLSKYGAKSIISALRDPVAEKIYSLRAPHLLPIIEKHEQIISSENTSLTIEIDRTANKSYRQTQKRNNIISKLKDLDNGD